MIKIFEKKLFYVGAPVFIEGEVSAVSNHLDLIEQYPKAQLLGDAAQWFPAFRQATRNIHQSYEELLGE